MAKNKYKKKWIEIENDHEILNSPVLWIIGTMLT